MGTGFLIHPDVVLTAAHVLHDPQNGPASQATFTPGCLFDPESGAVVGRDRSLTVDRSRYRVADGWSTDKSSIHHDYGAIFLPDADRYQRCGYLEPRVEDDEYYLRNAAQEAIRFWVAGFPQSKRRGTQWYARGWLRGAGPTSVRHYIDTTEGQSGAPLFAIGLDQNRKNIAVALGVHTRGASGDGVFNEARRIDKRMMADIERWYAEINRGATFRR